MHNVIFFINFLISFLQVSDSSIRGQEILPHWTIQYYQQRGKQTVNIHHFFNWYKNLFPAFFIYSARGCQLKPISHDCDNEINVMYQFTKERSGDKFGGIICKYEEFTKFHNFTVRISFFLSNHLNHKNYKNGVLIQRIQGGPSKLRLLN